ncbi:MAG: type I phosphomannose isomerase catalytic subunit [Tenacibaculum sp.]
MKQSFIKFAPILKEKIWGGEKLIHYLQKSSNQKNIGESWEISDVPGSVSVVANGELKGKKLSELIKTYKGSLVGNKVYRHFKNKFPLLIKYIDAKEALSIQLHPQDDLALKRHNSLGKTEMWYVMQADKQANLIVGFKKDIDKQQYLEKLNNKQLLDILNVDMVKKGDVYFIPAGRVHAIGAGVMLAEIQQSSDITYRIYDWDRKDKQGNSRELHTDLALSSINYKAIQSYRTEYTKNQNTRNRLVACPYFTTNILPVKGSFRVNNSTDSFKIYMCVEGKVNFKAQDETEQLRVGQTLLVVSDLEEFNISSQQDSELLEVYIP